MKSKTNNDLYWQRMFFPPNQRSFVRMYSSGQASSEVVYWVVDNKVHPITIRSAGRIAVWTHVCKKEFGPHESHMNNWILLAIHILHSTSIDSSQTEINAAVQVVITSFVEVTTLDEKKATASAD